MQKKITLCVAAAHFLMIFFLLFSPPKKITTPKKHIAVRMVQNKRAAPIAAVRKPPAGNAEAKVSAKAPGKILDKTPAQKPLAKKETAKASAPKTAAKGKAAPAKSKPIAQQKKPAITEKGKPKKPKAAPKVLQEIDEALAKIEDKVYSKPQSKLDVPQIKGSSPVEFPFPELEEMEEGTTEEALVSFLHGSLNLPDFGEVTIRLTVKKDGSVAQISVVKAESPKNEAYLKKNLPLLKFPLILHEERTFKLTFHNNK